MTDVGTAAVISGMVLFLVVVLTAGLASAHSHARLHAALRLWSPVRRVDRRALIVEIPILALLLVGGEAIVMLILVDSSSSMPARFLAGAEIIATIAWFGYLVRAIRRADPTS
jgi:hypothetical protein